MEALGWSGSLSRTAPQILDNRIVRPLALSAIT